MVDRLRSAGKGEVPDQLLFAKDVGTFTIRVFALLSRYAQQFDAIMPTRRRLAKDCECGLTSIDGALAELRDRGLLRMEPRFDRRSGAQLGNDYEVWPFDHAGSNDNVPGRRNDIGVPGELDSPGEQAPRQGGDPSRGGGTPPSRHGGTPIRSTGPVPAKPTTTHHGEQQVAREGRRGGGEGSLRDRTPRRPRPGEGPFSPAGGSSPAARAGPIPPERLAVIAAEVRLEAAVLLGDRMADQVLDGAAAAAAGGVDLEGLLDRVMPEAIRQTRLRVLDGGCTAPASYMLAIATKLAIQRGRSLAEPAPGGAELEALEAELLAAVPDAVRVDVDGGDLGRGWLLPDGSGLLPRYVRGYLEDLRAPPKAGAA